MDVGRIPTIRDVLFIIADPCPHHPTGIAQPQDFGFLIAQHLPELKHRKGLIIIQAPDFRAGQFNHIAMILTTGENNMTKTANKRMQATTRSAAVVRMLRHFGFVTHDFVAWGFLAGVA